jgi:hypothetical protein
MDYPTSFPLVGVLSLSQSRQLIKHKIYYIKIAKVLQDWIFDSSFLFCIEKSLQNLPPSLKDRIGSVLRQLTAPQTEAYLFAFLFLQS